VEAEPEVVHEREVVAVVRGTSGGDHGASIAVGRPSPRPQRGTVTPVPLCP
jgi:hypothetical protein